MTYNSNKMIVTAASLFLPRCSEESICTNDGNLFPNRIIWLFLTMRIIHWKRWRSPMNSTWLLKVVFDGCYYILWFIIIVYYLLMKSIYSPYIYAYLCLLAFVVRNKDMSWPEEMSFLANSNRMNRHKGPGQLN